MSLNPNVMQMLSIAKECGLTTLEEAHTHYMMHYDYFFLISDFFNQHQKFVEELRKFEMVDENLTLKELSIEEALYNVKRITNN